jgi:hypothetical protein
MSDYYLVDIPLDLSIQLHTRQPEDIIDSPMIYQSIIESLIYVYIGT